MDCINREDAIKTLRRYAGECCCTVLEVFEKMPAADAVEHRHGKWIFETYKIAVDETPDGPVYEERLKCFCSRCNHDFGFRTDMVDKFCRECGADMR